MSLHPTPFWGLEISLKLTQLLCEGATLAAKKTAAKLRRTPPKRGAILAPGIDTPLWNELVRQVVPWLRLRGSKAQLARILGLPRQRLQVCLKAKTGCLDAERTLLLLSWLAAQYRSTRAPKMPRPRSSSLNDKKLRPSL